MKKLFFIISILAFINISYAEYSFLIEDGSKKYNATINVEACDSSSCEGKATVKIFHKKGNAFTQTLSSDGIYFSLDSIQKPSVNIIQLYNEQSPLIFEDFNFDGTEDLAVRNGNFSSYGGPSYDVYVYHSTKKKFVISKELTDLVLDNLGMFQTDHKRKRLITFSKSGCCWHMKTEYAVIPKKGLLKVYEFEEDAASGGDFMTVTTRKLIGNKWVETSKKHKIAEYYKG